MVVGQLELGARAQHAVRDDPLHLSPGDLEATGKHRSERCERNEVTLGEVPSAAHHLDRLSGGPVHDHTADPVRAGDGRDLEHPRHDHLFQPTSYVLNLLDHEAEVVERRGQLHGVPLERGEIAQP